VRVARSEAVAPATPSPRRVRQVAGLPQRPPPANAPPVAEHPLAPALNRIGDCLDRLVRATERNNRYMEEMLELVEKTHRVVKRK